MSAFTRACSRAIASIPRPPVATFGAAVVASIVNAAIIAAIAILPWPDAVAERRITALMWLGLSQTALLAIVIISWAWGRPDSLNLNVAGQGIALDFDAPSKEPDL